MLIALHCPVIFLYGSLRLVSRSWRKAALMSMKKLFARMIRDNESKPLATATIQLWREGHLRGNLGDFGTWVGRAIDVDTCDTLVQIDVFRELPQDIINEINRTQWLRVARKEWRKVNGLLFSGGLRIQDPGRLACVLRNINIWEEDEGEDTLYLSIGRVLRQCGYLSPASVRQAVHMCGNRGSLSVPEIWTEIALAEEWEASDLFSNPGVDSTPNSSREQVCKNIRHRFHHWIKYSPGEDIMLEPEKLAIAFNDLEYFLDMDELLEVLEAPRYFTIGEVVWRMTLTDAE
ncbi:hypothetical protein M427DRAFT_74344 [Gonapodya prolifera JEL478]|uniref:Uncharacterized protein n=1 Tax=Gonapodya prolifera (strain JEL478) TaxID=1344416 RepID=A0A139A0I2_GONPJ|nr:hypothetical protein M427DRAFT_74344 [Gonapodya prolifera JEL478]|eukprot:KXS10280.1 hypothetical protein M427DRAFT_74344 [Gonapodya prolifera JEL478]